VVALLLNNLNKDYEYIVTIITQSIRLSSSVDLEAIIVQLLDESRRLNSIRSNKNYYPSNTSIDNSKKSSHYSNDVEMSMQTNSNKNTKNRINRPIIKCNYCNKKGHIESKCFEKYPNLKRDKVVNTSSNNLEDKEEQILASSTKSINSNIDFILDSGATIHTCYIKDLFIDLKPSTTSIKWGNTNKSIKAQGIGDISLVFNSTNQKVKITNVLFVPDLGVNLLSLSLITSKNYSLSFNKDNCFIKTPSKALLAKGSYKGGVSVFSATSSKPIKSIINNTVATTNTSNLEEVVEDNRLAIEKAVNLEDNSNTSSISSYKEEQIVLNKNTIELVHNRLGHVSLKAIKHLKQATKGVDYNLEDIENASISLDNCIPCIQSKLTKNRNIEASTKVSAYLDLIYIDIGGPIRPKALKGYKYYITFRDSFTKYLVIKLLKSRKNIVDIIRTTIIELELEAKDNSSSSSNSIESSKPFNNNKVKALQLDNEFKSRELDSYLASKGIITRYSSPYTPEQNGAAEIINRVILNKVRALLLTSNLPKLIWGEAMLTAVYLYNRTPSSSIEFKTPYYLKYKEIPNISNIRIFGSLTYYKEPSQFIKKLDSKATPYYLIGFIGSNIYKLYNPSSNKIITARDCKIIEGYFYKSNNNENIQRIYTRLDTSNNNRTTKRDPKIIIRKPSKSKLEELSRIQLLSDSEDELAFTSTIIVEDNNNSIESINLSAIEDKLDWKYLYNKAILENILATSNSILEEPKSYKEVLLREDKDLYLKAMKVEIEDLIRNNTWSIIERPKNSSLIKGRWVLTKKYNLDNTIKKYKARWVAKGFLQKYNINYKETFASTSKPSLIRLLLSIFAYLDWEIYAWDIKQAFPNAEIDIDNIYTQLPIGLEDFVLDKALKELEDKGLKNIDLYSTISNTIKNKDYSKIVCKLNKALYGLKQASRQWQLFLTRILEELGFTSLKIDTSIFISKDKPILLATHVDDILVFAKDISLVNSLYKDLSRISNLEISNLGEIKEFLGIEVIRNRSKRSIIITQKSFIANILKKYNKQNNKPKSIPLPIGTKLSKNLAESPIIKDFQQQIGSLIYLTIFTRPDLVYSINYLARFMANPSLEHYNYLDNIFSYLVKTKNLGLDLTLESKQSSRDPINLVGVSDSDWGGDLDSRKSTIGNIFLLETSNKKSIAISWISKLQKVVAISSAEAEYMSLKEATKESLYLQNIIKELFINNNSLKDYLIFSKLNTIKTDSLSAIELAKNPVYHARTKHVDITYHFVRENLLNNNIDLVYENTSTILADNLTKATSNTKFQDFTSRLNLVDL